jgi:hypothetical protein
MGGGNLWLFVSHRLVWIREARDANSAADPLPRSIKKHHLSVLNLVLCNSFFDCLLVGEVLRQRSIGSPFAVGEEKSCIQISDYSSHGFLLGIALMGKATS